MALLRTFSLAALAAIAISFAINATASAQEDASPPPPDPCCGEQEPE